MKRKTIIAWLLILAMLLGLVGCGEDNTPATVPATEPTVPPTTEPPGPDMSAYEAGIAKLESADSLDLLVKSEGSMTIADEVYEDKDTYVILYQGLQGESLLAEARETWIYCGEPTEVLYTYADGTTYLELEDGKFKSPATTEDFMDLLYPIVPLDVSLYQTITVEEGEKETVYTFADPTAAESWLSVEEEDFISAEATVTIVKENITEIAYNVSYARGIGTHSTNYTFQVRELDPVLELTAPETTDDYMEIEDIIAPLVLRLGYVGMAGGKSKTVNANSEIVFSAGGLYLGMQDSYNLHGESVDFIFKGESDRTYVDLTGQDEDESLHYEESYFNDTYTMQDSTMEEPQTVSGSQLAIGLMADALGATITQFAVGIDMLETITMEYTAGCVVVEFTGNADAGLVIEDTLSEIVMGGPDEIDSLADGYETVKLEGYMALDIYTMLPTAYGISYQGTHLFGSDMADLILEHNTAVHMPNPREAYENITGEEMPTEEPEVKPTPVFYKVTDAEGHTMWLLGTMHVGDQRTEYLPQEIYDAFDASDALAVEVNYDDFSEDLENDPELLEEYLNALYYTDETTVKDHLMETVYEDAVLALKAAGAYSSTMEHLKPAMWSQQIDDFYLRQWRTLDDEYGVDNQLMDRANEQEKPILSVEDDMEHATLFANFSDELQEFMLMASLYSSSSAYSDGTNELFEMWCRGDEAELIAYLAEEAQEEEEEEDIGIEELTEEDRAEMTEEELAVYDRLVELYGKVQEEYEQSLMTERNVDMLAVAKGYLSSGDTVFYAVGLAHLLGSDGLVATLRNAGYTVELVTYAQ